METKTDEVQKEFSNWLSTYKPNNAVSITTNAGTGIYEQIKTASISPVYPGGNSSVYSVPVSLTTGNGSYVDALNFLTKRLTSAEIKIEELQKALEILLENQIKNIRHE